MYEQADDMEWLQQLLDRVCPHRAELDGRILQSARQLAIPHLGHPRRNGGPP
jgi:hypothetical protein